LVDLVKDPESFDEAYNHPEADKKIMWRRAISKEFEERNESQEKFQNSEIPNDRTKRNGIFRARLVGCGYSQIPGVDFQECYAPVINDVSNLEFKRKSDRHRNGVPSWRSQGNNLHGDTKVYGFK
jgi:hypothetical protein